MKNHHNKLILGGKRKKKQTKKGKQMSRKMYKRKPKSNKTKKRNNKKSNIKTKSNFKSNSYHYEQKELFIDSDGKKDYFYYKVAFWFYHQV